MTLDNFVKLEPNVEKRLRIREGSFRLEARTIVDPATKQSKLVKAASMDVILEDDKAIQKTFSTLSNKLATQLLAAHSNGTLYIYTVGIKKVGVGYATEYQFRLY